MNTIIVKRSGPRRTLILGALALFLGACASSVKPGVDSGTASVGPFAPVAAILDANCTTCHGAQRADAGLRLDSWANVFAGSSYGEAVIAYDAENSLLLEMGTKLSSELAEDHRLTSEEVTVIQSWIDAGARNDNMEVPFSEPRELVYACNQGEAIVSIIDVETNQVIRTVDLKALGFSPTAKPHHVVSSADGQFWFLSLIGENKILKFDRSNSLVATAEFERPGMLVRHPEGGELRVGRSMSAVNPPQRLGTVDIDEMTVDEIDVFFPRPHALAIRPQGDYTYTASLAENKIMIVGSDDKVSFIDVEGETHTLVQFAISPDGEQLVVGGQLTGQVMFFSLADPAEPTLTHTLQVNAAPWHPVYSSDGSTVFFGNFGANTITAIDTQTYEITHVFDEPGIASPHGSTISEDGKYVYVSNRNLKGDYVPRHNFGDNDKIGTVVVIDTETMELVKVIELENMTTGLGSSN